MLDSIMSWKIYSGRCINIGAAGYYTDTDVSTIGKMVRCIVFSLRTSLFRDLRSSRFIYGIFSSVFSTKS